MDQQQSKPVASKHYAPYQKDSLGVAVSNCEHKKFLKEKNRQKKSSLVYLPPDEGLRLSEVDIKYQLDSLNAQVHLKWDKSQQSLVYRLKHLQNSLDKPEDSLKILEKLITDPYINEISYNSHKKVIEVYHRRFGLLSTNISLAPNRLSQITSRLAKISGQQLSYDHPTLKAKLNSGIQVKASLTPDLAQDWPSLFLKDDREVKTSPRAVLNQIDSETLAYLWTCLEHKKNVVIATDGNQKKTKEGLLSFLVSYLPQRKLAVLNTNSNIKLPTENVVYPAASQTCPITGDENKSDLPDYTFSGVNLKQCLQHSPDYFILTGWEDLNRELLLQSLVSGQPLLATTTQTSDQFINQLTDSNSSKQYLKDLLDVLVVTEDDMTLDRSSKLGFKQEAGEQPLSIYELGLIKESTLTDDKRDLILDELSSSFLLHQLGRRSGPSGRKIGQNLREKEETIDRMRDLGLESIEEHRSFISRFRSFENLKGD